MEIKGDALASCVGLVLQWVEMGALRMVLLNKYAFLPGSKRPREHPATTINCLRRTPVIVVRCLVPFVFCLLCAVSGCGVYSFSGSTLSGVNTIAVPLFDDQSGEYGIRESLTEKIADRFVQDNTLKVVNEKNADSFLDGIITKYSREAYTFDEQENVEEYIVRIWVKVSFQETKNKKTIWKDDNLLGWGVYSAQDETEDQGRERAVEKLAEDIVNKTVKGW
jgi:hypothetical protein